MKVKKDVFINFPCSLTFSQEKRDKTFKPPPLSALEPSPSTYKPDLNLIKQKSPQIKISQSHFHDNKYKNDMGPGDYNPIKVSVQKQISFGKNQNQQNNKPQNCPQYYDVQQKFYKQITNKYSMGEKINEVVIKDIVGPGRYFDETPSSFSKSNVQSVKGSFSQQKRFLDVNYKNNMGPLDYKIFDNQFQQQPQYSFKGVTVEQNKQNHQVGPGEYDIKEPQPKYAKSIGIRCQPKIPQNDIGPGQYDVQINQDKPFKMKTSKRRPIDFGKNDLVSSQSYELNYYHKNSKSCVFQEQNYNKIFNKQITEAANQPGPQSYRPNFDDSQKLQFTIPKQQRQDIYKQVDIYPGPDAYKMKKNYGGLQYSFSKQQKQKNEVTPGPGDYDVVKNELKQSFSIPKEGIVSKTVKSDLGPGKYQIQKEFGQIPAYQQKRLENHKYLLSKMATELSQHSKQSKG